MAITTSFQQLAVGRYLGSATVTGAKTDASLLINAFTIPANTVTNGVLVLARCKHTASGAASQTINIYADSSNPPTTGIKSSLANPSQTDFVTFCTFVTGLTWSSANYISIHLNATTYGSGECFEAVFFAF